MEVFAANIGCRGNLLLRQLPFAALQARRKIIGASTEMDAWGVAGT
jgi:hypothetical protein